MYQVLFTGKRKPEIDRKQVEANLQRLFKANARQVAWFLRGAPIVVKTTDDFDVAERYHKALTDAGLICTLGVVPPPKETAKRGRAVVVPAAPPPSPAPPAKAPVQVPLLEVQQPPARVAEPVMPPQPAPPKAPPKAAEPPKIEPPKIEPEKVEPIQVEPPPAEPPKVKPPEAAPPIANVVAPPPVVPELPVAPPVLLRPSPPAASESPIAPPAPRLPPKRFEDAIPDVAVPVSALPEPPRRPTTLLAISAVVALIVIGVLIWWKLREPPVSQVPAEAPVAASTEEPVAAPTPPIAPKRLAQLIRGRWFCLYGPRSREEVVFDKDGEFRSLQYGDPDSPYLAERVNVEMRGLYWISDNTVVVHVIYMPALERMGQSPVVDEHAVIRVLRINDRSLVWTIPRLDRHEQPCVHASIELYSDAKSG